MKSVIKKVMGVELLIEGSVRCVGRAYEDDRGPFGPLEYECDELTVTTPWGEDVTDQHEDLWEELIDAEEDYAIAW